MYKIAGLTVDMDCKYDTVKRRSHAYFTETDKPADMTIKLGDEFLEQRQKEHPHLSLDECESIFTGMFFYGMLVKFGGLMLHSSAALTQGKAYLFSAPSGVGKSTHTALWRKVYGEENVVILNDDKPAIRIFGDEILVFGTPWSGNSDMNINTYAPLGGICFLERGENNEIEQIGTDAALGALLNQTARPQDKHDMDLLLKSAEKVICTVPIYKMRCNMADDAAVMSYEKMVKE